VQANVIAKAITPEEYDDAARRTPGSCPLLVIGDTRSTSGHAL
jgi:hypothetical protein